MPLGDFLLCLSAIRVLSSDFSVDFAPLSNASLLLDGAGGIALMYGRCVLNAAFGVASVVDLLFRLQMPIDFLRPRFTEAEQKIFAVEKILLDADALPDFFFALPCADADFLLPRRFVYDGNFVAVFVPRVVFPALDRPLPLTVERAICHEYVGMDVSLLPSIVDSIRRAVSLFG